MIQFRRKIRKGFVLCNSGKRGLFDVEFEMYDVRFLIK